VRRIEEGRSSSEMILAGSQFSSHSSVFGEVHPPLSCRVPSPVKARRPAPRAFTCRPRDRWGGHRRCQPRLTPPGSPGGHCDRSTRPAHRPGPRHQNGQPRVALAPRLSAAAASPGSTSTAGRCSSWTGPSVTPDRVRLCDRDRTGGRWSGLRPLFVPSGGLFTEVHNFASRVVMRRLACGRRVSFTARV